MKAIKAQFPAADESLEMHMQHWLNLTDNRQLTILEEEALFNIIIPKTYISGQGFMIIV